MTRWKLPTRPLSTPLTCTALGLMGLVASGCASSGPGPTDALREAVTQDYRVEVENRNWHDMTVYAVKGTTTYRLGSIRGNASRTFRLPAPFVGRLGGVRLAARPMGRSELHYSEMVDLVPGQTLGWSLEPNLKLSFHWVSGA